VREREPALEGLATHSHLPVELTTQVPQRLPVPVEAAVYYVAADGLTNIAKYAHATAATVRLEESDGGVVLRIRDNGTGGASPERGTGLRGLVDRSRRLAAGWRSTAGQATGRCSRRESRVMRGSRRARARPGPDGTASRTPPGLISERQNTSAPYGHGVDSVGLYGGA
jgi:hypothetical protein